MVKQFFYISRLTFQHPVNTVHTMPGVINPNDDNEILIVPDDRIIERHTGCWNCSNFLLGEFVDRAWQPRYEDALLQIRRSGLYDRNAVVTKPGAALRVAQLTKQGVAKEIALEMVVSEAAAADPRIEFLHKVSSDIKALKLGICKIGANNGDFVYRKYLCSSWSGKDGASVARGTDKADELPEELKERIDGPAKK